MLPNAFQIPTVTAQWMVAVQAVVPHSRHSVVTGVAVGEAVWREQVDDIRAVESLNLGGVWFSVPQFVAVFCHRLPVLFELDGEGPRLCFRGQFQVEEKVVRVFYPDDGLQQNFLRLQTYIGFSDGWAVHQYLK